MNALIAKSAPRLAPPRTWSIHLPGSAFVKFTYGARRVLACSCGFRARTLMAMRTYTMDGTLVTLYYARKKNEPSSI